MKAKLLGWVVAVLFVLPVGCFSAGRDLAPDFTLTSIDGQTIQLSDSNGKVRIVDFWATWCPPCRKGIPEFVELYIEYKDKGLEIIGVSLDNGGMAVVKPFAEKMKMNYPVVIGTEALTRAYGGVKAIPTAFIIDQNGNIVKKYVGYQPKSVFEKEIKALLE